MSFWLSFHQALLGPTGAHWLDNPPDLSSKDSTLQYAVDGPLLSCKQQVGGSSPPASSQNRPPCPVIVSLSSGRSAARCGRMLLAVGLGAADQLQLFGHGRAGRP